MLSVVLYRAFPCVFDGRFIGVDVFFVISGYLLPPTFSRAWTRARFLLATSLARIRRIFPALILVMASSLIFGWFALLSEEFQQLGKHVASGAASSSISYSWAKVDISTPLQIRNPCFICGAWPSKSNFISSGHSLCGWLGGGASTSCGSPFGCIGVVLFQRSLRATKPTEVFFWPFGRFWELLSGSALAWTMHYKRDAVDKTKAFADTLSVGWSPWVSRRERRIH